MISKQQAKHLHRELGWNLKVVGMTRAAKHLQPGDRVEFGFCRGTDVVIEHLWIRVFAAPGKAYLGVLEADDSVLGIPKGTQINFRPEHIVRVVRFVQDDIH